MGKRQRINQQERKAGHVEVLDESGFRENLSSKNAKEIKTVHEPMRFEIWFDKHYTIRDQHGDKDGARTGIQPERIQHLVSTAFKHLLFYSARIKGFNFLNHQSEPATRVILKDSYSEGNTLYAVVQIHYKSFNRYQCTVITARCNDFRIGSGQYFVEFFSANESTLLRIDNGVETSVFSCED